MTGLEVALAAAAAKEAFAPARELIEKLGHTGYTKMRVAYARTFSAHVKLLVIAAQTSRT